MPVTRIPKRVPSMASREYLNDRLLKHAETHEPDAIASSSTTSQSTRPSTPLFPCTSSTATRRPSHHKKRPPSHIPRPPNAFILFRANFIRDRHLQASTDGPLSNVSPTALSTIVGMTWKNLPDEERQFWVEKARVAREEHKLLHPTYRYQPLPTAEQRALNRENKRRIKEENIVKPDIERCSLISSLLVQGRRGQELEEIVADYDRSRPTPPEAAPVAPHPMSRSSSLPTPPRRRPTRRPRASSTSDTTPDHFDSPSNAYHQDELGSLPRFFSAEHNTGAGYPVIGTPSYVEPAMPELTYDPASPSSVNLPELQDGVYLPNMTSSDVPSYHHSHSNYPRQVTTPHSLSHVTPSIVPPSVPFSSFTTWDVGQRATEPYQQFSYFALHHEPVMTADPHSSFPVAASNVDPYASSIPPFQLYHTLKPFEQPLYGYSAEPESIHSTDDPFA